MCLNKRTVFYNIVDSVCRQNGAYGTDIGYKLTMQIPISVP